MRLYLLPISTQRTMIYCQKFIVPTEKRGWIDCSIMRAEKLWSGWEKKESGWQRSVVEFGKKVLERIPFEEWALKSIPPLTFRSKSENLKASRKIEVLFPQSLGVKLDIHKTLRKLSKERQRFHRSRMMFSFIGMPVSAPLMIIPVIPNLPFFYLVFRAWSHWKALTGSRHLEYLIDNNLITPKPLSILDEFYCNEEYPTDKSPPIAKNRSSNTFLSGEKMLLCEWRSKIIAEALNVPELEAELGRAIRQVSKELRYSDKGVSEKN
ncbi:Uncharacterized protein C23H3.12c [Golovinomyces cichoracearum]|uniref:Uncharacterized protein C23H3.12c n=1 Tax=Golovinomyces cichoracearum TaxID=62708 RepID=A0A420ITY6_9PEZI|nr:Uncharacterized protein C23H3.12c [Golovinomyces cichoracearum]